MQQSKTQTWSRQLDAEVDDARRRARRLFKLVTETRAARGGPTLIEYLSQRSHQLDAGPRARENDLAPAHAAIS